MDATGATIRDFGIEEYPTLVLIDPEGRIVGIGNETVLTGFLERLAEAIGKP